MMGWHKKGGLARQRQNKITISGSKGWMQSSNGCKRRDRREGKNTTGSGRRGGRNTRSCRRQEKQPNNHCHRTSDAHSSIVGAMQEL